MSQPDPSAQYDAHADLYDRITDQVEQTFDYFVSASRPEQEMLLQQAATFSLISPQTPVPQHEAGYVAVLNADSMDSDTLAEVLRDAGVNYCNNKASYIAHNVTESDTDRIIDCIEAEAYADALRATVEEMKGVGMAKAGYALAKLGVPQMMCIDTHVGQMAGLEADDVYTGILPDKYLDQCAEIESQFPDLSARTRSRFQFQWVLFDANRDGVEKHTPWFESLPNEAGVIPP